jgi:ferredoxin
MAARGFKVIIEGEDEPVYDDRREGVLRAMERVGRAEIPIGCRNGGCGACKVLVLKGEYSLGKMSRQQVTADEERAGYALACRLYANSDIEVRPVGSLLRRTAS